MLNKIISFSLHNRFFVLLGAVLLMVGGYYTTMKMDVDVFPDLNAPTVVVMTEAGGMAPEEVERLVSFPIETAVNGAANVRRVRSSSTTGFSIVWVEFDWGTDIYRARQIVSEKLSAVTDQLPEGIGQPTMGPQSSILGELMFVTMTADKTSLRDLRTMADWTVRPRLLATGGVAQVSVIGGDAKEYQIQLDPSRMRTYGISLTDVQAAVENMNLNTSGGILYEYGNEYIVRGICATTDLETLGKAVVRRTDNGPVVLRDIADIRIGDKMPRTGVAAYNGKPCVILTVTKQPGASTIDLSKSIDEALVDVQKSLPADVKMGTDVYRQERFINSSIDNVKKSLYEGGIFVIIVLFVFLMNVRTTVISLVTIPISLVISLLILDLFGFTINTMSLGGMAIAIGSLVDDAIVDVENVFKRLRENRQLPPEERLPALRVIYNASREVRMPILYSTLIIIVSFIPLFFLTGMEGKLLVPLGVAFITALLASTLVALTLTPVLCSYLLGNEKKQKEKPAREPFVSRWLSKMYVWSLDQAIRLRWVVIGLTGVVLVGTLILFTTLGRSFLPPFNEGSFTIMVSTMPGISLEESDKIGERVEKILLSIPEIKATGRKTGRAELDEHAQGVNNTEIEAPFVLTDRSKEEVMDDIRHRLEVIKGISLEVGAPITHRIDAMLSGTRANIAIKIFGDDLNKMYNLGNQIKGAVSKVPGIADLNVEQQVERPQLQIIPRRELLAQYGITMSEFGDMVRVLLAGDVVSMVYEGNKAFDLTLRVADTDRNTADKIRDLMINADGEIVPLGMVADVVSTCGPNTINRENVARRLVVSANVSGRDLVGVVNDIQSIIDKEIKMPEGYHIEYGGQFENEKAASQTLLLTSLLSIAVIFFLLWAQFRTMSESVLVLLNLPLALIGGVLAIWVSNGMMSIPAIIGFISLFGIATRGGMLLISRYKDLREQGMPLREAVITGSADRLNPIMMTALTSALALVPLALGGDLPGNEIQSPMAVVILGGLFTSTLLNVILIPIMYLLTQKDGQPASVDELAETADGDVQAEITSPSQNE